MEAVPPGCQARLLFPVDGAEDNGPLPTPAAVYLAGEGQGQCPSMTALAALPLCALGGRACGARPLLWEVHNRTGSIEKWQREGRGMEAKAKGERMDQISSRGLLKNVGFEGGGREGDISMYREQPGQKAE